MLDTDEINQIADILLLDETGFTTVSNRAVMLAAADAAQGSNNIDRLQKLLLEITKYEKLIKAGQESGSGNIISTNVAGEVAVAYGAGGSVASVQQAMNSEIAALRALIFPRRKTAIAFDRPLTALATKRSDCNHANTTSHF